MTRKLTEMSQLSGPEEDRLGRAMTVIGREAARDEPADDAATGETSSPPTWWRRPQLLAAACVAAIVAIVAVVYANRGSEPNQEASQALNGAEEIACAYQIVDGRIASTEGAARPHEVWMTVAVDDWIKPATETRATTRFLTGSARFNETKPYRPGQRVLVLVLGKPDAAVGNLATLYRGEEADWQRRRIQRYLPKATQTKCPDVWRHPDKHDVPDDS